MRYLSKETMQKILFFVDTYYKNNGYSPTIAEIARRTGLAVGTVHKYLHRMNEIDMISLEGRHIVTPYIEELQGKFSAPVKGEIACGSPIYAEEQNEENFPIPKEYIGNGEYFWLRAKGNSMINVGINNNDLVLIRKQNVADEGDIIAALIENSATLKTYTLDHKNKKIVLISENDDNEKYPNQIYDDIMIRGIAVYVLKKL